MRLRRLPVLAVCLIAAGMLLAQSDTAVISGRITDPTGAAVPNAAIKVVDVATGAERTTVTNAEGLYSVPGLRAHEYRVSVTRDGFAQVVKTGIVLHVQDESAQNFELTVGSTSQSVTVTGGAIAVQVASPAVSTVIDPQFVSNMPLNGRTFQALISLVPGVSPTSDARQFNVNGQRGVSNAATVDGVSANVAGGMAPGTVGLYGSGTMMGVTATGTTQAIVNIDELQEFTVQTTGYGAELGRQSGGQISFATRSGTNRLHGSAYDYFRNEKMDANDWFVNRQGLPRPKLRQNDFGFTVGGPVVKDKTFFFVAMEDDPLLTPYTATQTVPTQAYRDAAAPALAPLLNMFPLPNGTIAADGRSGAYLLSDSVRSPVNAESLKLDQNIGSRLTMFARYHRAPSRSTTPQYVSDDQVIYTNTQTGTFGATYIMNAQSVDQFRFNWTRSSSGRELTFHSEAGTTLPPDSALWPQGYTVNNAAAEIYVNEGFTSGVVFFGQNQKTVQTQYQATDSVNLTRGKHNIKIGADWRRITPQIQEVGEEVVLLITNAAQAQTQGHIIAYGSGDFALNSLSVYAADTWKATPGLTLDLGLRWEFQPPPHAAGGPQFLAAQAFDPNNLAVATLAPQGTAVWKTRYRNFAPRVGAAYHLRDRPGRDTVLRGSVGLYYDTGVGDPMSFLANAPYQRVGTTVTAAYPGILSNPLLQSPAVNLAPPFSSLKLFDPNLEMPYTLSWNVGVEQSLGQDQSITANYVGNRGKRLLMTVSQAYSVNALITSTGSMSEETNLGRSWYDALQVQFNKRLSHGVQALVNYTLSRSTDYGSDETGTTIPGSLVPIATNRAPSSFDARHNFTAAVTWQIPAPRQNRTLRAVLGGWSLNPMARAYSAQPMNPTYVYSVTGSFSWTLRPDAVAGQPVWLSDPHVPGGKHLNSAAFSVPLFSSPSQVRQGTAARNSIRGFAANQEDVALRRNFRLTERIGLQLSGEAYNILNHPNFANPIPSFGTYNNGKYTPPSTATFGLASQMLSNASLTGIVGSATLPIYAFGGQRDIQLAVKVTF